MEVIDITIPSPGESITEVEISQWTKKDGEFVNKDETICEIDSDKATLEIVAEKSGFLKIIKLEGETVKVGDVAGEIQVSDEQPEGEKPPPATTRSEPSKSLSHIASPAAEKMMRESNMEKNNITEPSGKDGRITKQDVLKHLSSGINTPQTSGKIFGGERKTDSQKMSLLRRKIMKRLVSVKNETALLTTFNEVDMSAVMNLRNKYKKQFAEEKGVNLGFMSFFTKAITIALERFPEVNAQVDNENIVYHNYADVGIAVSSPKGLMVPVLRNAEQMSLAEIENQIKTLALKARDGKLSIDEMSGGTFTITNGGVFGSMMSTPIINPPQSAILGMHNIVERPIAVDGEVKIRPVMYLALSYDHRIIDGKESVSFLKAVKEMIENPAKMIFSGKEPAEVLLDL